MLRLVEAYRRFQEGVEETHRLRDEAGELGRKLFDKAILEGTEITDEFIAKAAQGKNLGAFEQEVWVGYVMRKGEVIEAGRGLHERLGKSKFSVITDDELEITNTLVLFDGVLETLFDSSGLEGIAERLVSNENQTLKEVIDQKVSELVLADRISISEEECGIRLVDVGLAIFDEVGELHITTEARDMVAGLLFGK